MDIQESIRTRRSIQEYAPIRVTRETLLELIASARYSPSGGNKNTWRFVIVTGREALVRLSEAHAYSKWLASAQAAIAIAIDPSSTRYWLEDCSVGATIIWLAATGKGLGVAWAAMYQSDDPAETQRRQALMREVLATPANVMVPIVLGVGYAGVQPAPKKRPSVDQILSWERYPAA